jgi:hypothetical protein
MPYKLAQGDTGSKIRATCKNDSDGSLIDLTGATVQLLWRDGAGALVTKTMTIVGAPTAGVAEYLFAAGEIFLPLMSFRVRITDAGGKILHNLDNLDEAVIATP